MHTKIKRQVVRCARLIPFALFLFAVNALPQIAHAATTRYVKPNGVTTGACDSWTNACTLQFALSVAISGDEIWVTAGTYKPTTGTDRTATFRLKNGVGLYGGFAAIETARDQRNFTTNVTTLSGEIGKAGNSDNSYHVVTGTDFSSTLKLDSTAILDGFTISNGNANGDASLNYDIGGGLCNCGNADSKSASPTVRNIIFINNSASYAGAGMFNWYGSSPTVINVTFSTNTVKAYGGAIDNYRNANPTLTNVTFINNKAAYGGAFSARGTSNPIVINATFSGNSGWNGGAIHNEQNSNPTLTNVTIVNNSAGSAGGAISSRNTSPPDAVGGTIVRNSIIWGNTAPTNPGIDNDPNGSAVITFSDVQGGYAGTGNLNADPLLGTLGNYGGTTQTIPILLGSPATDSANDAQCPSSDQRGVTRPQGARCDMGAFEFVPGSVPTPTITPTATTTRTPTNTPVNAPTNTPTRTPTNTPVNAPTNTPTRTPTSTPTNAPTLTPSSTPIPMIRFVVPTGVITGACGSWANACGLQYALSIANGGDDIWVKAGTYTPGTLRTDTFRLKNGVGLYGGFAGTEIARDQRNWTTNVTTLSGEIGAPGISDNSYHIVTGSDFRSTAILDNSAIIDGFTISGGNANGDPNLNYDIGGGLCNCGDTNSKSASPTVRNMIFTNNSASYSGAGMFNWYNSSPTVSNVTFSNNTGSTFGYGGGMDNYRNANPTLINVTFNDNRAAFGGAFSARGASNPTLINVTFTRNTAYSFGGAIHGEQNSNPTFTNVTIVNNTASSSGGAVSNHETSGSTVSGSPIIRNSIVWGNTAPKNPQIENDPSGSAVITYTDIEGGYTGMGNISGDPLLGALGNYGGNTQTIPISPGSAALDNANDSLCPSTDQRGITRPQGVHCDMGAYELVPSTATNTPVATSTPTSTPTNTPPNAPSATPTPTGSPTATPIPGTGITLRSVSSANNASGATSLTINAPPGVTSGDVLVAQVVVRGATTAITPPSGWTMIRRDSTSSSIGVALYFKVVSGAQPASFAWTFNSSQRASGGIVAYSGVDNTAPIDAHSGQYNDTLTSITAPSVTTTTANDQLIFLAAVTTSTSVTPPSGMTQRWITSTTDTTSAMADQALTFAGATGNRVGISAANNSNIGQLVALRPAP